MSTPAPDATLFDAAAVRDALTPPVFRDGRRRVVGRLLSVEEFWHHLEWWRQWNGGEVTSAAAWTAGLRAFLDAVFPLAWWERLVRRQSVADVVIALPFKRQQEAAALFFGSLVIEHVHAELLKTSEPGPTTSGATTERTAEAPPSAGPSAT